MKIEIYITEKEDGKANVRLAVPKVITEDTMREDVPDVIEKTCKIVWVEISTLLANLEGIK